MQYVLEKVSCKIDSDNIEDCRQLSKKSDNVIIKFSRRKGCQHVFRVKRDLGNLDLVDLMFSWGKQNLHKSEFVSILSDVMVQK